MDRRRSPACCHGAGRSPDRIGALFQRASNAGLLDETIDPKNLIVFLVTLGFAVFGSVLFRGFLSVIPILIAVIAGYVAAVACGIVDFSAVAAAPIFAIPNFTAPKFNMEAIMIIMPVILVITSEHIGHQVVTRRSSAATS